MNFTQYEWIMLIISVIALIFTLISVAYTALVYYEQHRVSKFSNNINYNSFYLNCKIENKTRDFETTPIKTKADYAATP